ncbi:MAG: glycosyltransferase [Acaryochloris sp. RU_4_1]|nr:glycosyltransferase [Acaryochloris sp. RU_4_1]NJR53978.1 glycosyltransferase [Acaryochloris sp. CRU_2_0]
MNALLLSIADGGGGAARAAHRLHQSLRKADIDSHLLVQAKGTDDPTAITLQSKLEKGLASLRPAINALPIKLFTEADSKTYSLQWLPERIATKINQLDPEVINLHWICDGFLKIETLQRFKCPLVWTLHDMWPFTGGCHYSGECDRYTDHCGYCPQLESGKSSDFSSWVWQRKKRTFKALDLTLVTPSQWLAECAQSSSLFKGHRVEVIPNGLDLQIYKPINAQLARQILNLPQDKALILFGAIQATSDRRKGFHFLQPILQRLRQLRNHGDTHIVIIGSSAPIPPLDLGFETHYLGTLKDDYSLALAYAAADVFVAPSVQDNLPNTVLEAISCGTPCIAFKIGGMPDLINHQSNGYLAHPFEIEDFAQGINWILDDQNRWRTLSEAARAKAEQEFTLELQASRYQDLFHELIESSRNTVTH